MTPDRKIKIGNTIIEEFWRAGKFVVYVNNKSFLGTYGEAVREATDYAAENE